MQQDAVRSPSAVRAAVRLLGDEDPKVHGACRRRLVSWGEASRDELALAAVGPDPKLRVRARVVIRSLDLADWVQSFLRAIEGARLRLEPGCVLTSGLRALVVFPALVPGRVEDFDRRLDDLADELRDLVQNRSSLTAARRIAEVLARRHGLAGGRAPHGRNHEWLPDRVLANRRGPASVLAALYLVVARRAGVPATGVMLPDFVLLRVHGRRRILLDPYHRGRTVTKADCLRYLRRVTPARPAVERLADVDDFEVLDRVIEDLILVHDRPADGELRDALREARIAAAPGRDLRDRL